MGGEDWGLFWGKTSLWGGQQDVVGWGLLPGGVAVAPAGREGHPPTHLAAAPCPCRSFENNWNIYKLLAHQKPAQEKVRRDGELQGTPSPPWGHTPMCRPRPRRAPSVWPS